MVTREELNEALAERHGREIQGILARSGAAVAGLGGLGSNIAFSLARTGIGYLHLIDFDRVDITNLNRQQYFIHQIGMKKTEALKENLLQINPGTVPGQVSGCSQRHGRIRRQQPDPNKKSDGSLLSLRRRDFRCRGGNLSDCGPGGALRGSSGKYDCKPDTGK